MRCGKINELLYLRADELSAEELKSVKSHISKCELCSKEFADITKTNEFIAYIRNTEPFLVNEAEFTDEIMQMIESKEPMPLNSFFAETLDRFSNFFRNTVVRATAVTIVLIIVSTFFIQQYFVFNSVSSLEYKLAVKNSSLTTTEAGFNELKVLKLAVDFVALIKGNRAYAEFTGDWILTNKAKLNEFLSLYSDLQHYKSLYSKEIEEKYPELNSFLEKKLNIEELQDFVKKNESLIKELSRKIPAGGK
jgi:hypothetical protein